MNLGRCGAVILVATTLLLAANAKAADPKLQLCDYCTLDAQFAQAAEHAAFSMHPFLFEWMHEVYVINPETEVIRYYTVTREQVGSESRPGGGYWRTFVSPGNGDLAIESDVTSALAEAKYFLSGIAQGIDVVDLGLGQVQIESAIELAGPGTDFKRGTLQNALSNYFSSISHQFMAQFGDLAGRLSSRFIAESATQSASGIKTIFPDGTSVNLQGVKLFFMIHNGTTEIKFEIDESSIQGHGLIEIPDTLGDFTG